MGLEEPSERFAVPVDAEGVTEGERHAAAGIVGDPRGEAEGLLRRRWIEQVALQVEILRAADRVGIHIGHAEERRRSEVGVHRALAVLGDEDQATARGRTVGRERGGVGDAGGVDVVVEHRTQLIVTHATQVVRGAAQRRDADRGVRTRPAARLDRHTHRPVQRFATLLVDEVHRPGNEALRRDEVGGLVADHVDECVADADDIDGGFAHGRNRRRRGVATTESQPSPRSGC